MTITESKLPGLFICQPKYLEDARGAFMEVFRMEELNAAGIQETFVQMNHSTSKTNVLRGLHFQYEKPLGKLIRVLNGSAFMVALDIRKKSATLGQWLGIEVSKANRTVLFAPPGFATGFCTVGDIAEVEYCYTAHYNPTGESGIRWNDPALTIDWPLKNPIVSERDQKMGTMAEWMEREEAKIF